MKIAYLVSRYPAVSHTFIAREIAALRAAGVDIGTFSVRRAGPGDILDDRHAAEEAARTRCIVFAPLRDWAGALLWVAARRPLRACRLLAAALLQPGMSLSHRIKWACYFFEAALLARWLARECFEHLHCHFGNSGASTGMLAAGLAGIPFSMTCHGTELLEPQRNGLARKVARASFVACVSHHGRAQLMLACPPDDWPKLHIVRCAPPQVEHPRKPVLREENTILCVGRLSREKGHLLLLEALALLRRQGRDFRCTLIGDGPMRAAIKAAIEQRRLWDVVRPIGALPAADILPLYMRTSCLVLPSLSEGVPVVLMEAMACGCPVIATRVGGVPELVQDCLTGRVVAPGVPEALAAAIAWVLDHPAEAQALGNRGQRFVGREFCQDASARTLVQLFCGGREVRGAPSTLQEELACPVP